MDARAPSQGRGAAVELKPDEGCLCQGCGRRYRVDFNVPDAVWQRIRPNGSSLHGGLLCGQCIVDRIEALGRFAVYEVQCVSSSGPSSVDAVSGSGGGDGV